MKAATKTPAFKLLERTEVTALIGKIKTAGAKLDSMIQQAAVQAAVHSHTHNEISLCQSLLDALPKSSRGNALREWFSLYAPCAFIDGEMTFSRVYEGTDEAARLEAIKQVHTAPDWTTLKPEPKFIPFDTKARLTALCETAKKALSDTENADKHKVTPEQVKALEGLLATM